MRQRIDEFLCRRLQEVGIRHMFGVPGDYNLELLQQLEASRNGSQGRNLPVWIGNCNELNAAYAADGYARINGLAALVTTEGVGALSALNGVAGAYSERVPVICINGSIPQSALDEGKLMHHTMADGTKNRFSRVYAEVTAAQAHLSPENAAAEVDRLILIAWRRKLPVYLELPADVGSLKIEVPEAPLVLEYQHSDAEGQRAACEQVGERLRAASRPVLLLGMDAERYKVSTLIQGLAERARASVAVLQGAKGDFPEDSPHFAGLYSGEQTEREVRELVERSDCLVALGFRRVDWTSGVFTDKIPATAVYLNTHSASVNGRTYQGVYLREFLETLLAALPRRSQDSPLRQLSPRKTEQLPLDSVGGVQDPITQSAFWGIIQNFLRPGDVIIAEDGTCSVAANSLRLPPGTTLIAQAIWGSIGYSVGCLLGTMLAAPNRRHLLLVGDGAFQLTVQEVSTIIRHGLKPYIFLINNQGYTIERAILGRNAGFNDIENWKYTEVVRAFSRDKEVDACVVQSPGELIALLRKEPRNLTFVEVTMDKHDAPPNLVKFGRTLARYDYGTQGP